MAHDVVDVFKVVADCALEPRSVVAANAAIEKNHGTHNLENIVKSILHTFNIYKVVKHLMKQFLKLLLD